MTTWTVRDVEDWLKKNGFDLLVKPFNEQNIDGIGLLTLNDNIIEQMISKQSYDAEQNKLLIDRFKIKLNKWKMQQNMNTKIRRPDSASGTPVNTSQTIANADTAYERVLTITPDHQRVDMRFFRNPYFCETMKRYLSKKFRTILSIKFKQQELNINLVGNKQDVKDGLDAMRNMFQSTETKIYNCETTDQKVMSWSKQIFSNSAVEAIQQIMNNEKIFTVWEKTKMFSGYYKVLHFNHDLFGTSSDKITSILNHEIDYIENVQMPNEKSNNFMKEIQTFIVENRQNELAIIQHRYPGKLDIKIHLFGRQKLVKVIRKKLQLLVTKHTLKKFEMQMTSLQHEHLVDNCFHQLKELERKYTDDGVIIRIRQKEFYAPQYLIDKVKHDINEFICHTAVCIIRKIADHPILTDEHNAQLALIVKKYGCSIEKLDSLVQIQTIQIPKTLTKSSVASNVLIEQSREFLSSLSVRQLSTSNGSIEIHRANRSTCLAISDISVVSTDAGATEERIPLPNDNLIFGSKSGRKILFKRWELPTSSDIEKQQAKQMRSIIKFIGSVFEDITNHCPNATTISFLTNDWQNFLTRQQLIEELIIQTKQVLQTKRSNQRVLFLFDNEQIDLYNQFNETMRKLQNNDDGFAQYACCCQEVKITVTTSKEYDLSVCEREINNYIQKHLSTSEIFKNANDLVNWNQHVINVFHKYSLDRNVLLNMNVTGKQFCLTGTIEDVNKVIEKYKLLCEILKLKSLTPMETSRNNRAYNIAFSYCQQDQLICYDLHALLFSEGYQICQPSSDGSISKSRIDRSDILLVYFSENYSQDIHCMADVNYAKSLGKIIIPIVQIKENQSWLQSMTIAGLFYNMFNQEIELEFTGDFNLEYDKILSVLLRYTKPGVTGQQYEQIPTAEVTEPTNDNYEETAFGHVSLALQKVTKAQYKEKETTYQLQLKKRLEVERIKDDELKELTVTIPLVINDLEATLRGETIDHDRTSFLQTAKLNKKYLQDAIKDFINSVKRWLKKTPNVIQKNIIPFTPTGDINDALFLANSETIPFLWLINEAKEWDNSSRANGYFSLLPLNPGCWFTSQQAADCFQHKLKVNGRKNLIYTAIEENEVVWNTDAPTDSNTLGDEVRSAEEMQEFKKLDDLNNLIIIKKRMRRKFKGAFWIQDNYANIDPQERSFPERFFERKILNIIELKKLCEMKN